MASGANVTVPGPGLVASVAGKVETHAQSAPPVRMEFVPSVPPVLAPMLTVWKVPPERVIAVLMRAASAGVVNAAAPEVNIPAGDVEGLPVGVAAARPLCAFG